MTRDRESLHVEAESDADVALAVAFSAMVHGVRDEYDDLSVTAHGLDKPFMWTEVTYSTEQQTLRQRIAAWTVAHPFATALTLGPTLALAVSAVAWALLGRAA